MTTPKKQDVLVAELYPGRQQGATVSNGTEEHTLSDASTILNGAADADLTHHWPETAATTPRNVVLNAASDVRHGKLAQSHLERRGTGEPYGRLPNSCNRHFRTSRTRASTTTNKPTAFVDAEMDMGLARGSKVAEQARRAVRQANAQVCFANFETARKEVSLGVMRKKYKRLEADMFRSRLELADTLGAAEKETEKHNREMALAEERAKKLEAALRAADEALRKLTMAAKQSRHDAEGREASLRDHLATLESRIGSSERECRLEKLSTWATVARETDRAAARERYRMAAFLQRYVLENEYLRVSLKNAEDSRKAAEDSTSILHERLRKADGKLDIAPAEVASPQDKTRQAASTAGRRTEGLATGPGYSVGKSIGMGIGDGEQGRGREGGREGGGGRERGGGREGEEVVAEVGDQHQDTVGEKLLQQLKVAPRPLPNDLQGRGSCGDGSDAAAQAKPSTGRLERRAAARNQRCASSGSNIGGGCGSSKRDDACVRGSRRGRRGSWSRPLRTTALHLHEGSRFMRGLVAELTFLLFATEGERDSLASLLVVAERRMDQLVATQEELALKLAWGNVSAMQKQHLRLKEEEEQQQQQQQQQKQQKQQKQQQKQQQQDHHRHHHHRHQKQKLEGKGGLGGNACLAEVQERISMAKEQQQQQQQQQQTGLEYDDGVEVQEKSLIGLDQGGAEEDQRRRKTPSDISAFDQSRGDGANSQVEEEAMCTTACSPVAATTAAAAAAAASTFEQSKAALETIELKHRIRQLETLLKATESGAREIEKENRRLKSSRGGYPPAGAEKYQLSSEIGGEFSPVTTSVSERHEIGPEGEGVAGARLGGRLGRKNDVGDGGTGNGLNGRCMSAGSGVMQGQYSPFCLPMLSAAEIGVRGGSNSGGGGGGQNAGARAKTADAVVKRGFSVGGSPGASDWGAVAGTVYRQEHRCLSRSFRLAQQQCRQGCAWWHQPQKREYRRRREDSSSDRHGGGSGGCGEGDEGGEGDGGCSSNGEDDSLLLKSQLAWVLGLPDETTTETELLAEVMHLVVERGNTIPDASVLEAQLRKMDDQSLSLTRLVASTACIASAQRGSSSGSGGRNDPAVHPLVRDGNRAGRRWGEARSGGGGGGLSFVDAGGNYSSEVTFLSSLSHDDGGGGGVSGGVSGGGGASAARAQNALISSNRVSGAEQQAKRAGPSRSIEPGNHAQEKTATRTETARPGGAPTSLTGGGRGGAQPQMSRQQQPETAIAAESAGVDQADSFSKAAGPVLAAAAVATAEPSVVTARETMSDASGGNIDRPDVDSVRSSFPKILQGRMVSIDIYCNKIWSKYEIMHSNEEGSAHGRRSCKADDAEYEIRVEAYDPAVLKQHMLYVTDEHIRRCLRDHPQIHTLGPHRTRVHRSLADRLFLVPEDEVLAELSDRERRGNDGENSGSRGGGGMDRPSFVATVAASGGGAASSGVGPRGDPKYLLVLVGDAGEIVTAEKPVDDVAEGEGREVVATPVRMPHRHAKSAIAQLELEGEIVQGAVYQYNAPLPDDDFDAEQAGIVRGLLATESDESSENDDEDDEEGDEDDDDYSRSEYGTSGEQTQ